MSDKSAYIKMLCGTRHALKEAQAYQTKEFLGGKDKNEIRYCCKLAFFHKSIYLNKSP